MGAAILIGPLAALLTFAAGAGEIIGNTYIGEKNGYIEIAAPGGRWHIKDREGEGTMIATLTVKDAIEGSRPSMTFWGLPNPGGVLQPDFFLSTTRAAMTEQGVEIGPVETLRIGGKQAYSYRGSLERSGQTVLTDVHLLQGKEVMFMVQCMAIKKVFDTFRPMCAEVLESVRY